ncbi:MAG TPA: hypothetical protein VJC07_01800 [Candidatus Nanoarchaeia archaeon]|nr:hypothetical protein [Candidatus Nanoarchaeia archaeon]
MNEEALSASPKYAKARLCFPSGQICDISERETAHVAPNHNPMNIAKVTNSLKFVANPITGNMTSQKARIITSIFLCPYLSAKNPAIKPPIAHITRMLSMR